jgi:hypothetical protein
MIRAYGDDDDDDDEKYNLWYVRTGNRDRIRDVKYVNMAPSE